MELDVDRLESDLDRIERTMGEQTSRPLRLLLASYAALLNLLEQKNLSMARLKRLVFGATTERPPAAPPDAASPPAASPEPG